jgi:hypothetical protein
MVLSWVPNCAIAQVLTGVDVWSMTSSPTARTGEEAGSDRAATRWPTPVPGECGEHAVQSEAEASGHTWWFVAGPRSGWGSGGLSHASLLHHGMST